MNILVTGATGFIGGAITKKILNTSTLTNSNSVKILTTGKEIPSFLKRATICHGDLRDYKSIEEAVSDTDIVINCAAVLPHYKLRDSDYWEVNALGTQNVVDACVVKKVKKLIHISTVGIYGSTGNMNISEKSKPSPQDVYAKSKLEAEKVIKNSSLAKRSIIIRPTICYGPGDIRPVFLKLFKMTKLGINLSVNGGNSYLHTIYIDNLVNIIVQSVYKQSVLGKDFIVGDIICPRIKDIVDEIIHVQYKKCVNVNIPSNLALTLGRFMGIEKTVKFVSENRKYNIGKMRKYFNVNTNVELSAGIKNTYDWYKNNNIL